MIFITPTKICLALSVFFVFFFYNSAVAQFDDAFVSADIILSLSPAYPGPREQVSVSAQTYSFDVNTVSLSWYVNGKLVKSGKGATDITVTTGAIGTPTTINITASQPTTHYEKSLTIWPSELDVMWHANTYTPVGYRGKALPVRGSTVTLVALPSFAAGRGPIDPKTLLYEWRVDDTLQKTPSGKGKNILLLPVTKSKNVPPDISVRVYNEDKSITKEKHITLSVREPELLFYEIHPLQGPLYQQALGNLFRVTSGGETRILAEPYYSSGNPSFLNFQWNVDNVNLLPDTQHSPILSYRSEVGSVAQQNIILEIQNPFNILEQIRKSFRIHVVE